MSTYQPKTILFLAANPKGTSPLRLGEEIKRIETGLERAKRREQFRLVQKWAVTDDDLRRALLDHEPHIVHFSGHGAGDDGLAFEDAAGELHLISGDALARVFKLVSRHVECVVLNACLSEPQAKAISRHIPYVVGMKHEVGDQAAIKYVVGFYDALGAGRLYEEAHEFGRSAIDLKMIPEHLTPVLRKKRLKKSASVKDQTKSNSASHQIRYFYYISKQKTEMLAAQFQTLPAIPNSSLVSQVTALLESMRDYGYLKPLSELSSDASKFYIDKGEWHHGLFGFNATGEDIVSYFLWKIVDFTLILLVGSPNNILGESVVRSGLFVPGTSGALLDVLRFVRDKLKTEESTAVSSGPLPSYGSYGRGGRNTKSLAKDVVEPASNVIKILPASSLRRRPSYLRGLGEFCINHLADLTIANIEVVFKIYSTFNESESSEDMQFSRIILASPLYVAID